MWIPINSSWWQYHCFPEVKTFNDCHFSGFAAWLLPSWVYSSNCLHPQKVKCLLCRKLSNLSPFSLCSKVCTPFKVQINQLLAPLGALCLVPSHSPLSVCTLNLRTFITSTPTCRNAPEGLVFLMPGRFEGSVDHRFCNCNQVKMNSL